MLWRWSAIQTNRNLPSLIDLRDRPSGEEGFTAVQHYPYLPPENWNNFKEKSWEPYHYYESEYKTPKVISTWNPLWDSDNAYHPIAPKVTRYESPHIEVSKLDEEIVEEQPMIGDIEPEMIPMPEPIEKVSENQLINMETMIMFIVFVGIIWYFSRQ